MIHMKYQTKKLSAAVVVDTLTLCLLVNVDHLNTKFHNVIFNLGRLGVNYFEKVINYIQLNWKLFN